MKTYNARNLKVELPRVITADWLRERRACEGQLEIFARQWPDGAELTAANVMAGVELGLSLNWLAEEALTTPALSDYWETTSLVRRAYWEAMSPARRVSQKAASQGRRAYQKARVAAFIALVFCDTAGGPT